MELISPLALAQCQAKHDPQSQSRFDRQFGIAQLAALLPGWQSFPSCDCFIRKPDRQAAAIAKAGLILSPVRDPELLPRNVVTDGGAKFERHERDSRRRERKHAVPSDGLTNQPIRPSCTKVAGQRRSTVPHSARVARARCQSSRLGHRADHAPGIVPFSTASTHMTLFRHP